MPNLTSQVIGKSDCLDCGKPVVVKVNKRGIAYFFCPWPSVTTGNVCNAKRHWGPDKSQIMQAEYLANREKTKKEADNDNGTDRSGPTDIPTGGDEPSTPDGDGYGDAYDVYGG